MPDTDYFEKPARLPDIETQRLITAAYVYAHEQLRPCFYVVVRYFVVLDTNLWNDTETVSYSPQAQWTLTIHVDFVSVIIYHVMFSSRLASNRMLNIN